MIVPDGRFSERSIGFDAGHSEEPSGLSAKPRPSSRCGLSAGPDRGAVFAVDGNGVGLGNSPLGRQVSERTGHASRHGSRVQCGRHIAHRSLSLLVHGNCLVVAAGCRFCGAHAHPTEGRFSPRHAIRSLRSCGRVAQAAASRMDVARRIRHNSGNPFDARVSLSCCSPGLSSTNNRGCHDAAGQRTVQRARHFRSVSSSLGCRNQLAFPEDDDEHGRASLPYSRNGSQGNLGSFAGLQPDPNGNRSGRRQARQAATPNQLHPGHAHAGILPVRDCPHREPTTRDRLRTHVAGHRFS